MEIKDHSFEVTSFETFSEKYGLTLEIRERPKYIVAPRYYACFSRCEISEPGVLISAHGDGNTKVEAINDYKMRIAGQLLVINAYTDSRREIQCPNEWQ